MKETMVDEYLSELQHIQDQWDYIRLFKSDMCRDEYESICIDMVKRTTEILDKIKE